MQPQAINYLDLKVRIMLHRPEAAGIAETQTGSGGDLLLFEAAILPLLIFC